MRFVRAGARYTGMDFSATALELARWRLELEGGTARFVRGSIAALPFSDASFDLVYSNSVIHHLPETRHVIGEFHRVLRPGGTAIVMVYHCRSFNFYVSVMVVRRTLAALLLIPGAEQAVGALTGEQPDVLRGHRVLREHGPGYLTDPQRFLSHNTDGPGNPLSKVYTADAMRATDVRFLNLRAYPGGDRLEQIEWVRRWGRRAGWHLWVTATKGP